MKNLIDKTGFTVASLLYNTVSNGHWYSIRLVIDKGLAMFEVCVDGIPTYETDIEKAIDHINYFYNRHLDEKIRGS